MTTTIKEVTIPDIGSFSGVEVIEVAVQPGAMVNKEDTLITLETEKASMDVPAPFSGKLLELKVKLGDKVSQGDLVALMEIAQENAPASHEAPTTSSTAPTAQPTATNETLTITVPDTGGAKEVEVIEVVVKPGDDVSEEATLITLESEKASMDIPSPHAGKVASVLVKVGDKVSMGTPIVTMQVAAQAKPVAIPAASSTPEKTISPTVAQKAPSTAAAPAFPGNALAHAGPATRRLARELGVDLSRLQGTGRKGRIVTADVQAHVKTAMASVYSGQGMGLAIEKAPEIDFTQFGEIEIQPLSRIKKWTAKNLHRNWVSIPHITQFDEADINELELFRQENKQAAENSGVKLTPLPFIIKAVVAALKEYPQFNASLAANGTDLILKKYYHIGVAVDTPNGLMVPVIKHADAKGLFELAAELAQLALLAIDGKLKNDQMSGSCFTISSLGSVGGTAFTPIINAPDVAILGVSKAQIKPVYQDEQFVPRKMLPLCLSYDHRVIDGVEGAKFMNYIVAQLQDIRKLLL